MAGAPRPLRLRFLRRDEKRGVRNDKGLCSGEALSFRPLGRFWSSCARTGTDEASVATCAVKTEIPPPR
jgi:hypothetical protein